MGDTIQLAITLFVASWILSMFLGAGLKGLVRAIGTVLSAIILFLAQIISTFVAVLAVIGVVLIIWAGFRFLRWLLFGPQPHRRWRHRSHRGYYDSCWDLYDDDDTFNTWH